MASARIRYAWRRQSQARFTHVVTMVEFCDGRLGAAAIFQAATDVCRFPLQIGRAYVLETATAKAKAAYQDFLTLWKDADPDIPIFIAAKAEYAKLK